MLVVIKHVYESFNGLFYLAIYKHLTIILHYIYTSVSQGKLKLNGHYSSKGVQIIGPSIKLTWHSHTPQRMCSDSYLSFGPVMNCLLLDQTNFYWTLSHVKQTLKMTDIHVHVSKILLKLTLNTNQSIN